MSKTLVAYFSASGVTEKAAEMLSKTLGSDIYKIEPKVPYTAADLNWQDSKSRSSLEMKDKSFRPEIVDTNADIENYDTVFLGFPIWWYTAPRAVNTFLEKYDFSGKTIILFATSGGSGFCSSREDLKKSASDAAKIKEGKLFRGTVKEEELKEWIKTLNI
ncbi:MAG: NAD(P)H-dependent oxidoreductase [Clostridia bacterium]|nr:NAD(P)H-dependent oxidoreductase [Clostridia bacterium]